MNLLFLTIGNVSSIKHHEIYPDLLREFFKNRHNVYIVCSREKREDLPTEMIEEDGVKLLKVHIGNITKTNMFQKGISTVLVGLQYKEAIKRYFPNIKFDLVMYSTPPITFVEVIEYIKKKDNSITYLLLKDIFPQNALDIGALALKGIKGVIYWYFRRQEKKLYAVSDRIGCMSKANVDYVIDHNPEVNLDKVEVCPNSIEVLDKSVDAATRKSIRIKYGVPLDKTVFIYGGNLGKPQGIPFLIECLKGCSDIEQAYFLIVGNGTEYGMLEKYKKNSQQKNLLLMKWLPKKDYDIMIGACDIGLIFLDHRFTIPNFPSRILGYMQAKIPVIACTDINTDIGKVIMQGEFGWWCESNDIEAFRSAIDESMNSDIKSMGENAYNYLKENWNVTKQYYEISKSIGWIK